MKINREMIEALRVVYRKLINQDIKWVLAGSLSLALQGVGVKPRDIDILTTIEDAFMIGKSLSEYEVKPIRFSRSEFFESYLGEYRINNIKIEVMGGLKEKVSEESHDLTERLSNPVYIDLEDMHLPVSPLEDQLRSYRGSSRKKDRETVIKIMETLEKYKNEECL